MLPEFRKVIVVIAFSMASILSACGGSSDGDNDTTVPVPVPEEPAPIPEGRSWTIAEIIAEPRRGGNGGTPRCGGEFGFRRCLCVEDVPSSIRYRPSIVECNNNAGAILYGDYAEAFSIVVRDSQNKDRWPAAGSGFGGCSFSVANSESPPNSCSAFKVQDKFRILDGNAMVHCFGSSGYSDLFSDVVRMTIKLSDDPFSSNDDIDRICLVSGDKPLN